MVYGMRSTHGMPSSQDTAGGYATTDTPCIPSIPYTTGDYAKICVPRILSILHTMDAIGKQIVSRRGRFAIRSRDETKVAPRSLRDTMLYVAMT